MQYSAFCIDEDEDKSRKVDFGILKNYKMYCLYLIENNKYIVTYYKKGFGTRM